MHFKRYFLFLSIGITGLFLSGCLKQHDNLAKKILEDKPVNLVELLRVNERVASATTVVPITVNAAPAEENVLLGYVRFASPSLPQSAVRVKLKLNNALLPATYPALPANAYSLVTPLDATTVAPGTRMAPIAIVLRKAQLDPALTYGLALEVEDAGTGNQVNPRGRVLMVSLHVQ